MAAAVWATIAAPDPSLKLPLPKRRHFHARVIKRPKQRCVVCFHPAPAATTLCYSTRWQSGASISRSAKSRTGRHSCRVGHFYFAPGILGSPGREVSFGDARCGNLAEVRAQNGNSGSVQRERNSVRSDLGELFTSVLGPSLQRVDGAADCHTRSLVSSPSRSANSLARGGLRSRYRLRKQTVEPVFGVISFVWIFQNTGLRILTT